MIGTRMMRRARTAAALMLGALAVLAGGLVLAASAAGADPSPTGFLDRHPRIERYLDLRADGQWSGRFLHSETTYLDSDGAATTLSAIAGSVTAVGPTSITVQASDGVTRTYAVDAATKVALADPDGDPRISAGAIADVRTGDSVVVAARGPAGSEPPATRILVRR